MAAISSVVPFGSPNTEQYLNNDTGAQVCVYIFYLRAEKREISLMFYYAKIEREKKTTHYLEQSIDPCRSSICTRPITVPSQRHRLKC